MSRSPRRIDIRNTRPEDFEGIIALCRQVYPHSAPWTREQLASHLRVFPEGQFVGVDHLDGHVVGVASSLIVRWDDHDSGGSWRDFTAGGMFTNHDPANGRTLYAAEVMVDPTCRGQGLGKRLYAARRRLAARLGLRRIRAGARLRGYHRVADVLTPTEYVMDVVMRRRRDPTLSFQLSQGFHVIGIVSEYLRNDPESLGHAALIEWLTPAAKPARARTVSTQREGPQA